MDRYVYLTFVVPPAKVDQLPSTYQFKFDLDKITSLTGLDSIKPIAVEDSKLQEWTANYYSDPEEQKKHLERMKTEQTTRINYVETQTAFLRRCGINTIIYTDSFQTENLSNMLSTIQRYSYSIPTGTKIPLPLYVEEDFGRLSSMLLDYERSKH